MELYIHVYSTILYSDLCKERIWFSNYYECHYSQCASQMYHTCSTALLPLFNPKSVFDQRESLSNYSFSHIWPWCWERKSYLLVSHVVCLWPEYDKQRQHTFCLGYNDYHVFCLKQIWCPWIQKPASMCNNTVRHVHSPILNHTSSHSTARALNTRVSSFGQQLHFA